jgi:hypothetical protein
VNDFSIDLGMEGKDAVLKLMEVYKRLHPHTNFSITGIFVEK